MQFLLARFGQNGYNGQCSHFGGPPRAMPKNQWTLAEAKGKFSQVINRAISSGPQSITRNGHLAAVIVSAEEWERKTRRAGNLAEFFAASPLRDSALQLDRAQDAPRDLEL